MKMKIDFNIILFPQPIGLIGLNRLFCHISPRRPVCQFMSVLALVFIHVSVQMIILYWFFHPTFHFYSLMLPAFFPPWNNMIIMSNTTILLLLVFLDSCVSMIYLVFPCHAMWSQFTGLFCMHDLFCLSLPTM